MSPPPISYWLAPAGRTLLERAIRIAHENDFSPAKLALQLKGRADGYSPHELNAVIDLVVARHKAALRLGAWCDEAFLTCRSVEQASRPEIARYRALSFRGAQHLLELGTGGGFDTAELARVATRVTSLEPDGALAEMARHNLALQGLTNVEVINTTAEEYLSVADLSRFDALYADPSRRDESGNRLRDGAEYLPPVDLVLNVPIRGPVGMKVSPALELPLPEVWSRQFIGFNGECLEQTLWRGRTTPLATVCLADSGSEWFDSGASPDLLPIDAPLSGYLFDPHPALVRARAIGSFYAHHGLTELDPHSPYGVSPNALASPFGRSFRIIESFPYRLRDLKSRLDELAWTNRTEIKKRGVDDDPDAVRTQLKLPRQTSPEDPFGVVLLARRDERIIAILAERLSNGER